MGRLRRFQGDEEVKLTARMLVGRSPNSDIVLDDLRASSAHAMFLFLEGRWAVHDLSSKNGTRVNGNLVPSGTKRSLNLGDVVSFGCREESWQLSDDEDPELSLTPVTQQTGTELAGVSLLYDPNSEPARIALDLGSMTKPLPERYFNQLLVVLAQARQADQARDLPPMEQGWLGIDQVVPSLFPDTETLNVAIFRLRRQFSDLGVVQGHSAIERRPQARLLRLGISSLGALPPAPESEE